MRRTASLLLFAALFAGFLPASAPAQFPINVAAFKSSGVSDTNAQAFITAAGITDSTQKQVINQLVIDLKSYGLWTKMQAIYPFVGGTAASHKWNLKDPRDLNAAFRLTEHGTTVNDASGTQTDEGQTAYWDTHYVPATNGTLNSTHVSVYVVSGSGNGVVIGTDDSVAKGRLAMRIGANYVSDQYDGNGANNVTTPPPDVVNLFTDSRTSSTVHKAYYGDTSFALDSGVSIHFAQTDLSLYILALNSDGAASDVTRKTLGWVSIGTGLSDADVANLYTVVDNMSVALGREA